MSRCAICDYCRETDGGSREVRWNTTWKEFRCSRCSSELFKLSYGDENKTFDYNPGAGEVPLLDLEDNDDPELSVEGLDLLSRIDLEGD